MDLLVLMIALGFTIGTTVLASRKGRNPVNWFFLSLFWGVVGLIILACSKDLDKAKGERDTLAKVLWLIIIIPIILIVAVLFFYKQHKRSISERPDHMSYIERKVDLNDYFNSSNGWDDDVDWNATDFSCEEEEYAFQQVLEDNGIYWSDAMNSYVVNVEKTVQYAQPTKRD